MLELKILFDITPAVVNAINAIVGKSKDNAKPDGIDQRDQDRPQDDLSGMARYEQLSSEPVQANAEPVDVHVDKEKASEENEQAAHDCNDEKASPNAKEKASKETEQATHDCNDETVNPKPKQEQSDDPLEGMSVAQASQKLLSEVRELDLDMVEVNKRVRAKAQELGLTYGSIACLIKNIGYKDARSIALNC